MTSALENSERQRTGKFYGISLLIHVGLLGVILVVPGVREHLMTRIQPPLVSADLRSTDSGGTDSSALEHFLRAVEDLRKEPMRPDAVEQARIAGQALADAAGEAREKFAREQAGELAKKLGISPGEAMEIFPQTDASLLDFERRIRRLSDKPQEDLVFPGLVDAARKLADATEKNEQMTAQLAQGETPAESLTILPNLETREAAKTLLASSAEERSTTPRDLTGLMRSFYGEELAATGEISSAPALLADAVPGRVQPTRSGLRPPPVLDNKWLSSVYKGETLSSLAASRISAGGTLRAGPLFLDSWYVLGPWPLESSKDFGRAFPPESEGVHLDADYVGKRGRHLRWEFVQSGEPLVEIPLQVPDSTTYAFTTLSFDRATEAWMLCGSDDRMKLWINGLPIFGSAASLKGWHIGNEGARKVFFRKGRNEILLRVDNLPGFTRFSVVLMPSDSEDILFSPIR